MCLVKLLKIICYFCACFTFECDGGSVLLVCSNLSNSMFLAIKLTDFLKANSSGLKLKFSKQHKRVEF